MLNTPYVKFWHYHFTWPLFLFAAAIAVVELNHLDLKLADWIYSLQGHQWLLRDNFITSTLLHEVAQDIVRLIGLITLILAITSHFNKTLQPYKKGLWMLFISTLSAVLIVSTVKAISHVDCPWDLQRYGGTQPYLSIFQIHPGTFAYGRCFPAGHASGGYGFIALYFFLVIHHPPKKWLGLIAVVAMGLIFGIAQQLRGAHFLSHDIWAVAICWFTALFWYWWFHRRTLYATIN